MEIILREAIPNDAKNLLDYLQQVNDESDFLVLEDLDLTVASYSELLEYSYASKRHLMLLALMDDKIVGMVNVNGSPEERRTHTAEIGISVAKKMWHQGLASALMEEMQAWWEEESTLTRLELYVVAKNFPALNLYLKNDFKIEGRMSQGIEMTDGSFDDLIVMGKTK